MRAAVAAGTTGSHRALGKLFAALGELLAAVGKLLFAALGKLLAAPRELFAALGEWCCALWCCALRKGVAVLRQRFGALRERAALGQRVALCDGFRPPGERLITAGRGGWVERSALGLWLRPLG